MSIVQAGVVDDDESIGLLMQMTDPQSTNIFKFCFDLILARKQEGWRQFHKFAPLPSPLAVSLLMLLPGAKEIVDVILKPLAEKNPLAVKQLNKVQSWLQLASMIGLKDLNSFLSHRKSKM